jgi:transposase-like protein
MPIVPQAGGLIMEAIACRRRAGGRQRGGTPVPASPYVIRLDDAGRAELEAVSRRATAPFRLVQRARIVLLAAGGLENRAVAARLGTCEDTARKWRRRYCEAGLSGLADAPRPGRPRKFPARVVAEVKALACQPPAGGGKPLARWTCPDGSPATRSSPGSTGRGSFPATRTSPSRAAASSTSTSENGKDSRSATTSTS